MCFAVYALRACGHYYLGVSCETRAPGTSLESRFGLTIFTEALGDSPQSRSRMNTVFHYARKFARFIAPFASAASVLLAVASYPALAQSATGAGTQSALAPPVDSSRATSASDPADATNPPSKPSLGEFAWLAGRWQGAWGPRVAQQVWTAPKAGIMMGTFQLAENDKTLVLELFTMVDGSDGIKFHLRHFTPSLVAWEKPGPTVLDLLSADAKSIVFENPVDGQPKRTTITRVDPDTYILKSEIVPEKGDPQITEITYHRVKDVTPAKKH